MSKAKFLNKATVRGRVAICDVIEFDIKNGARSGQKDKKLNLVIDTGDNNRVSCTMFNTAKEPSKVQATAAEFPKGTMVEVSGRVVEQVNEEKGRTYRSVSIISIQPFTAEDGKKPSATFVIHGIVTKFANKDKGAVLAVRVDNTYTPQTGPNAGKEQKKSETFTLSADTKTSEILEEAGVTKQCNAKFSGYIINKFETDEFNEIIDSKNEFKIAKVKDVVDKDDLTEDDEDDKAEMPFR